MSSTTNFVCGSTASLEIRLVSLRCFVRLISRILPARRRIVNADIFNEAVEMHFSISSRRPITDALAQRRPELSASELDVYMRACKELEDLVFKEYDAAGGEC